MPEPLLIRARPPRSSAIALLTSQGLPVSDLTEAHLDQFFYAGDDRSPAGLVGLEIYETVALLRSLVVAESARTHGLGSALTQYAERFAASKKIRSIYLLTTTAEAFFERLGYRRVNRAQAPASIARTPEFSQLCPASSAFMCKPLKPNGDS
jgi:amino-acid N-acetyltransferase